MPQCSLAALGLCASGEDYREGGLWARVVESTIQLRAPGFVDCTSLLKTNWRLEVAVLSGLESSLNILCS